MLSLCIFAIGVGCGETEVQTTSTVKNASIDTRSLDCEDCPVEDCCCEIEWQSGMGDLVIELCGPTGPFLSTAPCGPVDVGNCFTIEGFYLGPVTLNSGDSILLFCMPENSSFLINVIAGNAGVDITCQKRLQNPQIVPETLDMHNRYYFTVDGNCELDPCH